MFITHILSKDQTHVFLRNRLVFYYCTSNHLSPNNGNQLQSRSNRERLNISALSFPTISGHRPVNTICFGQGLIEKPKLIRDWDRETLCFQLSSSCGKIEDALILIKIFLKSKNIISRFLPWMATGELIALVGTLR
jgi:hypothetical protein